MNGPWLQVSVCWPPPCQPGESGEVDGGGDSHKTWYQCSGQERGTHINQSSIKYNFLVSRNLNWVLQISGLRRSGWSWRSSSRRFCSWRWMGWKLIPGLECLAEWKKQSQGWHWLWRSWMRTEERRRWARVWDQTGRRLRRSLTDSCSASFSPSPSSTPACKFIVSFGGNWFSIALQADDILTNISKISLLCWTHWSRMIIKLLLMRINNSMTTLFLMTQKRQNTFVAKLDLSGSCKCNCNFLIIKVWSGYINLVSYFPKVIFSINRISILSHLARL